MWCGSRKWRNPPPSTPEGFSRKACSITTARLSRKSAALVLAPIGSESFVPICAPPRRNFHPRANRSRSAYCGGRASLERVHDSRGRDEHRLPRVLILADAQPIARTNQRQTQQTRLPLDLFEHLGIGWPEILQPGI